MVWRRMYWACDNCNSPHFCNARTLKRIAVSCARCKSKVAHHMRVLRHLTFPSLDQKRRILVVVKSNCHAFSIKTRAPYLPALIHCSLNLLRLHKTYTRLASQHQKLVGVPWKVQTWNCSFGMYCQLNIPHIHDFAWYNHQFTKWTNAAWATWFNNNTHRRWRSYILTRRFERVNVLEITSTLYLSPAILHLIPKCRMPFSPQIRA